ncbi:cellulose biosynthesis protein BcsQ [Fluoribacter dumoffii]|uniref:cellulose biosynthesis protein BcsQ n=1 Tax=Fluoribacter dumoffii TaxID=463 RepID=UPI0022448228|nr:cellulose biosynthesis protein BcsQ [Fluoribacter dumoffii]MCW8384936.1 cellulose biosynthesis protein BcsQ [Fluoribacter dumoffii]MCW8417997.1 cellulose biosynthesis protein BcsQ [Fluoribacter dumoffii]MCW8454161.1 cellulose biosynthesis protein BcsQ [Fluoribacter dumoffii]MCW8461765.1 cellulose biosynthesis protein BcsQ [Fluoribacter dumoffii]MCW8481981.1 cellulose biosynthesis protein BcsQ [Fluoribacter dumoffii]
MPIIALQGIRGGVGVTSIAAGLAWALQQLHESALVIDFTPDNLLRLHFNMPFEETQGWARAHLDKQNWKEQIHSYGPLISYLPFGKITQTERVNLENELQENPVFWQKNFEELIAKNKYHWILLDLPADATLLTQQGLACADRVLLVLTADMNCHIRLHQQKIPEHCYFLINYYSPAKSLQKDLYDLWQRILPNFLPLILHSDEALAEALAAKKPTGEYHAHSLIAQDCNALAEWCLNTGQGRKNE